MINPRCHMPSHVLVVMHLVDPLNIYYTSFPQVGLGLRFVLLNSGRLALEEFYGAPYRNTSYLKS
jgi:hypothetical protein